MKKTLCMGALLCALATGGMAQKIDFNLAGRSANQVTETGYTPWAVNAGSSNTLTLDNGVTLELNVAGAKGQTMKSNWWKDAVSSKNSKLIGDCVAVYGLDGDGNMPVLTNVSTTLNLVLKGLTAGEHSVLAYHNVTDVYSMNTYYWRVDEEDAEGNVYQGETWMFRPRHLAELL